MERLFDSIEQLPKSQIKSWHIPAPAGPRGARDCSHADLRFVFIIFSVILAKFRLLKIFIQVDSIDTFFLILV